MRRDLAAIDGRRFDVVVVGGGIHGAAIARDAALRGLTVCLLERDDFGAATSGNSLGIVHGGLRDLKALDLPRLREMARERRAWLRTAPHLVAPLPVLVPFGRPGDPSRAALAAARPVYDALTVDRNRGVPAARRIPRGRLLGRAETLARAPWLEGVAVAGALLFHDARMVDPDRLTLAVVRGAAEAGAVVANGVEARRFPTDAGRVAGVEGRDRLSAADLRIHARVVVNAAGPWAGALSPAAAGPLALAMNVVLRRPDLAGDAAVSLPGRGRLHFLAPWGGGGVAVGTGYWLGRERPDAETVRRFLEEVGPIGNGPLGEADVTRVLAGRLPCGPADAEPLRHASVTEGPAGLVSVVGVKYTTARAVAERAVDLVVRRLGRRARASTATTPLPGAEEAPSPGAAFEARLAARYGGRWGEVARLALAEPALGRPLAPGTPVTGAEVVYAMREEMALDLADVAIRRTGLAAAGWPGDDAVAAAARLVALEAGWDPTRTSRETAALRTALLGWRVERSPAWSTAPRR